MCAKHNAYTLYMHTLYSLTLHNSPMMEISQFPMYSEEVGGINRLKFPKAKSLVNWYSNSRLALRFMHLTNYIGQEYKGVGIQAEGEAQRQGTV